MVDWVLYKQQGKIILPRALFVHAELPLDLLVPYLKMSNGKPSAIALVSGSVGMQMITPVIFASQLALRARVFHQFGEVDDSIESAAGQDPVVDLLARLLSRGVRVALPAFPQTA